MKCFLFSGLIHVWFDQGTLCFLPQGWGGGIWSESCFARISTYAYVMHSNILHIVIIFDNLALSLIQILQNYCTYIILYTLIKNYQISTIRFIKIWHNNTQYNRADLITGASKKRNILKPRLHSDILYEIWIYCTYKS